MPRELTPIVVFAATAAAFLSVAALLMSLLAISDWGCGCVPLYGGQVYLCPAEFFKRLNSVPPLVAPYQDPRGDEGLCIEEIAQRHPEASRILLESPIESYYTCIAGDGDRCIWSVSASLLYRGSLRLDLSYLGPGNLSEEGWLLVISFPRAVLAEVSSPHLSLEVDRCLGAVAIIGHLPGVGAVGTVIPSNPVIVARTDKCVYRPGEAVKVVVEYRGLLPSVLHSFCPAFEKLNGSGWQRYDNFVCPLALFSRCLKPGETYEYTWSLEGAEPGIHRIVDGYGGRTSAVFFVYIEVEEE